MAEKNESVKKALAIMAKNKKAREAKAMAEGQKTVGDAGIPANMMENVKAGISEYGTDAASSGRAMLEKKNEELAQELLRKQQKKIKGY